MDLFYGTAPWIAPTVFVLLILAGIEAGYRLGRRALVKTGEKLRSQIAIVEGALVGVLGLLLAFTMSMAVTRFETRKQLVLEHANAIGTSYLRTKLLPASDGAEIADRLRDYVDVCLNLVAAGEDHEKRQALRGLAERLQHQFWGRASAYGQKDPNPVRAGLLLQSLNQVIDLEAARWMAFHNHVPSAVIYLNAIVALLTMTLVGYAFGIDGVHHVFSMYLLGVAITVVLAVVVDLDRPSRGFIHVSQQPIIDLQHQLSAEQHSQVQAPGTSSAFFLK